MVPFAGRYRVVDFALRNAVACDVRRTIIVSDVFDDLAHYVESHPQYRNDEKVQTKVYLETKISLAQCARLLFAKPTQMYILYNGDCPLIVDFEPLIWKHKAKKAKGAVLYMIDYDGRPTLARTALICDRVTLEGAFRRAIREKVHSPHIFETIINSFIIKGVKRDTVPGYCRPISTIAEYYHANYEVYRDEEVSRTVFADEHLKSGMNIRGYAFLGAGSDVRESYLGEGCEIHGTVKNSVIFPGVYIGEKSSVLDSVILPYCRIGNTSIVERAVIDEFTDKMREEFPYNVGHFTRIGRGTLGLKNSEHPNELGDGITLVGKNCALPDNLTVGSASYIASGVGADAFGTRLIVDDGISVMREAVHDALA